MKKKLNNAVWYDARGLLDSQGDILEFVFNSWFDNVIFTVEQYRNVKMPQKIKPIVFVSSEDEINGIALDVLLMSDDIALLEDLQDKGYAAIYYIKVYDQETMLLASRNAVSFSHVVVDLVDPTNIPLELLIASLQNTTTFILKVVHSSEEADISLAVMEIGSDGVVLQTNDVQEISAFSQFIQQQSVTKMSLVNMQVTRVQHIGRGSRVCIDTTSILGKNEGMIIGSTSEGGLLVSSETHYLPYMNSRPFRVNAGALHSYVWSINDTTEYLSDLKAGSAILTVDTNGNTREVHVGRIKIEERPMLLIEAKYDQTTINTIVQDDWHIRIFGKNGKIVNASEIVPGDELLGYVCEGGRHVGIKIDEKIQEQ